MPRVPAQEVTQISRPLARYLIDQQDQQDAAAPIGVVQMYASATPPKGWLACDGAAVSRRDYAELYAIIGTTFGSGDGSSTFNVPDLRGRVVIGAGTGTGLTARAVGDTGGAETVTLTEAEIPAHDHDVTDPGHVHTVTDPGHVHSVTDPGHSHTAPAESNVVSSGSSGGGVLGGDTGTSATGISIDSAMTGVSIDTATTDLTVDEAGGGGAHENMPPFIALGFIIRAR